jgi:hypothetical protein
LSINPRYQFSTLDGHIANDVLLAYVWSWMCDHRHVCEMSGSRSVMNFFMG